MKNPHNVYYLLWLPTNVNIRKTSWKPLLGFSPDSFSSVFLLYKISTSSVTFLVPSSALTLTFFWVLPRSVVTDHLRLPLHSSGHHQNNDFFFPFSPQKKSTRNYDLALNITLTRSSLRNTHRKLYFIIGASHWHLFIISEIYQILLKLCLKWEGGVSDAT